MALNQLRVAGTLLFLQSFITTTVLLMLVVFATIKKKVSGNTVWSADHGFCFRNKVQLMEPFPIYTRLLQIKSMA
jgi:hypothetical protein